MFNRDIIPNAFLFNSNFSKISTGIKQRFAISSPGIYLEEILKLINQTLLKLKFLNIGAKQPKKCSLTLIFVLTKQIYWSC